MIDINRINVFLQRFLDDDGPEGPIAIEMFKNAVKDRIGDTKQRVTVFFTNSGGNGALIEIIDGLQAKLSEANQQIATKDEEISLLLAQMKEKGIAPKKSKVKSFPWDKYPDLEMEAFRMIFVHGRTMREVRDMLQHCAPEAEGNTTFINSRFVQSRPSERFDIVVKDKNDGSETSWAELWRIGTVQHADGWIQRVMHRAKCWSKFRDSNGNVPKNWPQIDPNDLISATGRKTLRRLFWENGFEPAGTEVANLVMRAGLKGITRVELKELGIGSRRVSDMSDKSIIFENDGRLFHYSFAANFPDNPAAKASLAKSAALAAKAKAKTVN